MIINRARPEILALTAYSSARSLATGDDTTIYLDANEMPCEPVIGTKNLGRYAPQQPEKLVAALAALYETAQENILVTRGADEGIDILTRLFCTPGQDNIVISPPAFPMYEMSAQLNNISIKKVPLLADTFTPDTAGIIAACDENTKIVYICTPNNPTGALAPQATVETLCQALKGKAIIVADEAYIEFSGAPSATKQICSYDNLVVLRTLSKAMALAGVRCGTVIARPEIINECRKVLAPYPVPVPVTETVLKALEPNNMARMAAMRQKVLATKAAFCKTLATLEGVEKIFPSDTNFVLVRFASAQATYQLCKDNGIILRNQSHQPGLANCIRIAIGSDDEMDELLYVLQNRARRPKQNARAATITRTTKETAISVSVNLDMDEPVNINTGIGFYDHMLEQVARHGGFALKLEAVGDTHIDSHHTVEDCAIALGQAIKAALGNKAGIGRYGFTLPMDEALASVALDLSGRALFRFEGSFKERMAGELPTDMVVHIFRSLAENMNATIHLSVTGENTHHMVEACFKALGRALRQAISVNGNAMPSSKGVL